LRPSSMNPLQFLLRGRIIHFRRSKDKSLWRPAPRRVRACSSRAFASAGMRGPRRTVARSLPEMGVSLHSGQPCPGHRKFRVFLHHLLEKLNRRPPNLSRRSCGQIPARGDKGRRLCGFNVGGAANLCLFSRRDFCASTVAIAPGKLRSRPRTRRPSCGRNPPPTDDRRSLARISWTLMRTALPDLCTLPSRTFATPRRLAISGIFPDGLMN